MMTRKDYEKATEIVKQQLEHEKAAYMPLPISRAIVQAFVDLFRHDNPRFDVKRFRKACGQEA